MYKADLVHPDAALEDKLERLFYLWRAKNPEFAIRADFKALLFHLGNPHESLPPVIHVAGTNGKGSTIAFMRAIAEAAGLRVHAYTSPHLVRFNERIYLSGSYITDEALHPLLDEVLHFCEGKEITFFEATTALAFKAFSDVSADLLLLETGLGGRLDCTNVVACPAATVITPISFDHTEFLGSAITTIATEKAGILKPGVPCFLGDQVYEDAAKVIEARAAELSCRLYKAGRDWHVADTDKAFTLQLEDRQVTYPKPAMSGNHQFANAA